MSVDSIEMWHRRARPDPTDKDFNVQLGCHAEEFVEMLDTLASGQLATTTHLWNTRNSLNLLAKALKDGTFNVRVENRKEFLDSLADQIVTAVGVGHCAGMKTSDACDAVNSSNWSKFDENGQPIFDENGKITKGPNYHKPILKGMY